VVRADVVEHDPAERRAAFEAQVFGGAASRVALVANDDVRVLVPREANPRDLRARVRYTGASVAFNVGGIIGGGMTPLIAEALVGRGGLGLVGGYLSAACALSLAALFLLKGKSED
jgi:hypothetical protein